MRRSACLAGFGLFLFLAGCAPQAAHAPADSTRPSDGESAPTDPALQAAAALYDGIRTETLDNGLRVYLKPIPGAPVVTTMVAYKVGSADEDLDTTGLSHYLEHLMFKGTDKLMPGDIDRLTLRNGGQNNAYTTEDYTVYHFDFARDRWPIALEIEADRMRNLRIDDKHEFQQEKGAVINELARNEDEPWDLERKAILPLLFGKSAPYGHPVIGEREHVRGATAEVIKAHYDRWYHPNNAALVIVGGFDPDQALAAVKKLFGPIPASKLPERKKEPDPSARGKRPARLEIAARDDAPRLLMGFNTVSVTHRDDPVLDVIQTLLTGGRASRLYRTFVEGELATTVSAYNASGRYPGWFGIEVELLPGTDRAKLEEQLLKELKRLRDEPVPEAELQRARQVLLSGVVFSRESVHGLADSIARGVTVGDLEWLKGYLPRLTAVTAHDIQRVAKEYFDPEQRVVVWSVPKGEDRGSRAEDRGPKLPRRARANSSDKEGFSLAATQRVELPNGLVLLLLENRRLPFVVAEAHVHRVVLHEPEDKAGVATLTGYLLSEGTARHTGPQIAEMIESVGGTLEMSSSGGSVKVLAPHRRLGLGLLFECLAESNFPKDAFAREKQRLLATIDYTEQQPEHRAQLLYRALAYGKHPLGRPALGRRQTVETLTRDDCAAFHRRVFVPNNTVVAIVGDFDSKAVVEEVKELTAGWKKAELPRPEPPVVEKPKEFVQQVVTMPQAAQLHFYMGHAGIRRNDSDYYKLLVMDYVLGTGPGFTDRLSARLRDRQGLAYAVSANITSSAGEEPGLFTCYIGTDPENFDKVKTQFLEELNRIRDEPPADKEVEDAKQYLIHSLPFRFTTNDSIASQLLYLERYGLGFDYLEAFSKAVAAVTPADVQAVAKKHLDPMRLVLAAAGPVDGKGRPLPKLPPPKK